MQNVFEFCQVAGAGDVYGRSQRLTEKLPLCGVSWSVVLVVQRTMARISMSPLIVASGVLDGGSEIQLWWKE